MTHLPSDFAEDLAQVLEPSHRGLAAGIIEAASRLDDEGLRAFLELFAQRVRESAQPITHAEMHGFLAAARKSGPAHGR
jgi:hypothetical protein